MKMKHAFGVKLGGLIMRNSFVIKCSDCGKEIVITQDDLVESCTYIERNGITIAVGGFADIWLECECGNKIP